MYGKTRAEQVQIWGEETIAKWETSDNINPPLFEAGDPVNPAEDPRYSGIPNIPQAESFEDTFNRIKAYWQNELIPFLRSGKTVMVVGHSNALRCLSKSIDDSLDMATLKQMLIPNTTPIIYTLDANMNVIDRRVLTAN